MAGDCPHRNQLLSSLQQCQEQTEKISLTHENYLSIVNELKNELDNLSCEVSQVHQEFSQDSRDEGESPFESSLQQLIQHNDRLQKALEQITKEKDEACMELAQNTESLHCKIENLQRINLEKEQCISQLNLMLSHLTQCQMAQPSLPPQMLHVDCDKEIGRLRSQLEQANRKFESIYDDFKRCEKQERFFRTETRKLNDELVNSKRINADCNIKICRLTDLVKSLEEHKKDILQKNQQLEADHDEKTKKLRKTTAQLHNVQELFDECKHWHDANNTEKCLLRDEVIALKEKEAILVGRLRGFRSIMAKQEKELGLAEDVINQQKCGLQHNELAHQEIIKQYVETIRHNKTQFYALMSDYKNLEKAYRSEIDLRKQVEGIAESFRKWKDAQIKSDEATRSAARQYEEHIKLLLEEKEMFLDKYRELHCEYGILQRELNRMDTGTLRNSAQHTYIKNSENLILGHIEQLRRTALRVWEQSRNFYEASISEKLKTSELQQNISQ